MKSSTLIVAGVAAAVVAYVVYSRARASARAAWGTGAPESPSEPMLWDGSKWVKDTRTVTATGAVYQPPAPPPPVVGGAVLSAASWGLVSTSSAKVPPIGTVDLLPIELATATRFNPPA